MWLHFLHWFEFHTGLTAPRRMKLRPRLGALWAGRLCFCPMGGRPQRPRVGRRALPSSILFHIGLHKMQPELEILCPTFQTA
jgi:hypothetical protein